MCLVHSQHQRNHAKKYILYNKYNMFICLLNRFFNHFLEWLTKLMMQQSKVTGHGILETISRRETLRQADARQTHRAVLVNK